MPVMGHCLCKAVTYSIDVERPNRILYCHCDDCQRYSGSTYGRLPPLVFIGAIYFPILTPTLGLFIIIPKNKINIRGPIKSFIVKGGSGHDVGRAFCNICGSGITQSNNKTPNILAINGGSLDNEFKKTLKPVYILLFRDPGLEANILIIRILRSGLSRSFLSVLSIWLTLSSVCPFLNKDI
jgi:hypothetical protein